MNRLTGSNALLLDILSSRPIVIESIWVLLLRDLNSAWVMQTALQTYQATGDEYISRSVFDEGVVTSEQLHGTLAALEARGLLYSSGNFEQLLFLDLAGLKQQLTAHVEARNEK